MQTIWQDAKTFSTHAMASLVAAALIAATQITVQLGTVHGHCYSLLAVDYRKYAELMRLQSRERTPVQGWPVLAALVVRPVDACWSQIREDSA